MGWDNKVTLMGCFYETKTKNDNNNFDDNVINVVHLICNN